MNEVQVLRRRRSVEGPPGRATAATAVYDRLRSEILSGALDPASKLRIEFLCQRYEAGASPVREALNRLSAEGFVDREDQRGFSVAPVSLAQLRELVQTRCWLEGRALQEAIAHRTDAWEEGIVLSLHRLSRQARFASDMSLNPEWERYHHAFHHALLATCGSSILLRFCQELREQADRYRLIAARSIFPKRNERDEHRAIAEATINGLTEEAIERLMAHYRRTLEIIEGCFSAD
jgi:GntR family carbon starvation induced transcriptional regulator